MKAFLLAAPAPVENRPLLKFDIELPILTSDELLIRVCRTDQHGLEKNADKS
jgi:hypothetical protein